MYRFNTDYTYAIHRPNTHTPQFQKEHRSNTYTKSTVLTHTKFKNTDWTYTNIEQRPNIHTQRTYKEHRLNTHTKNSSTKKSSD